MLDTAKNENKKYFRMERFLFKLGGISFTGDESIAYQVYSWVNLVLFNYMYPFIASLDLFKRDFNDAVDSWLYVVSTLMANCMIFTTSYNRLKVGRLLDRLENEPFIVNTDRGGAEEEKLHKSWISFTYKQGTVFCIGIVSSIMSLMLYTFISRIRSSDYHDWNMGFGRISVVNVTYSPNYEISMLYQNLAMCSLCCNMCGTTLIVSGTLANIGTQFKLLQNNLKRMVYNGQTKMMKDTTNVQFSNEGTVVDDLKISWKYLQESLKEAVQYHIDILDLANEVESVFSEGLLTLYIGTFMIICLEVYRASLITHFNVGAIRLTIETLSAMFHSMIICYSGEQMANESEQVAKAAFQSEFVGTDLRFQKSLVLIIRAGQNPIRIKAGKFIDTSLMTFAWILRTSYSAYMVLRNTNTQLENPN